MNKMLKMKIVLRPSGNKAGTTAGAEPDLNEPQSSEPLAPESQKALPAGLRHPTATEGAQESLRVLARQRVVQTRVRRIKRAAWAIAAAAAGWAALVAARKPDEAVASHNSSPPVALARTTAVAPKVNAAPATSLAVSPAAVAVAAPVPPTTRMRVPGILEGGAKPALAAGLSAEGPQALCDGDFGQGRWRAAIESCGLAFDAQPGPTLALKIAHAHWASGKVDRAGTWARKAVELGTEDADAFVLIGHSERQAGDVPGAMAAYRRYLRWSPRGWHAKDVRAALRDLKAKAALESAAAAPGPT